MYWPPSARANNKATISDAKFAASTGVAVRHDPYVMDATFLAPWLSWDDDEGPWAPSDPMCRVVLLGESGIQLRAKNTDVHGSIIMLTSGPAGVQMWEVVSFFDWYQEGETTKSSAFCWCRLWDGLADPDDGGGDGEPIPLAIAAGRSMTVSHTETDPSETWTWDVDAGDDVSGEGWLIILVAFEGPVNMVSVHADGHPAVKLKERADSSGTNLTLQIWAVAPWTGGLLTSVTFLWDADVSNFNAVAYVVAGVSGKETADGDAINSVGADISATASGANANDVCLVISFAGVLNLSATLAWDPPTVSDAAHGSFTPGFDTCDGRRFTAAAETASEVMTGITGDAWVSIIISLF